MDNSSIGVTDSAQSPTKCMNGSMRRPSPSPCSPAGAGGRPASLMDHTQSQPHVVRVVVNRDDKGYGMKVSGDNPVYVQSVKEGGAAEKAGLHAGDKIIKVNGVNVMNSTHTQVVALIKYCPTQRRRLKLTAVPCLNLPKTSDEAATVKSVLQRDKENIPEETEEPVKDILNEFRVDEIYPSSCSTSSQVVLTVQQRSNQTRSLGSPSLHNRPVTSPTTSRITGPQPVDNEKQYQLQLEKEQYYKLMIEKEQHYVDLLRSQIASSPDEKKCKELAKTERNLQTLQGMLLRSQSEQQSPPTDSSPCFSSPSSPQKYSTGTQSSPNGNSDVPPPLPKRNNHPLRQRVYTDTNMITDKRALPYINGKVPLDTHNFLNNEINANLAEAAAVTPQRKRLKSPLGLLVLDSPDLPPPLPPRASHSAPLPQPLDPDAVNSINKQMSYPLVATCATLVNDCVSNPSPNPTHHRTKSSPETLMTLEENEGSRKLSESMDDLSRREEWETPPGTPPPPYPSPQSLRREGIVINFDGDNTFEEQFVDSTDITPGCRSIGTPRMQTNSSPIHAATPQTTQQPIMSMEDDEVSDTELSQLEDHGHFQSFSKLWEHPPHLAVFTNYILSNSDPNSLMFYLLTDLYKEGNAKEMRKWAFEIHSCFLVPGAPLRLSNVDENIAREIDEVLTKEYDKEEILRKVFWKARHKAKEELTNQLADFRQKRTAGLGTIYGPTDQALAEVYNDKAKEVKLYETLFLEKLEPYLEEIEKESFDPKRYYTAAAFTTVLTRIFQIRPVMHALDRCPTFVNKEKSFRTKFIGKYSRKLNVQGHQYVAQQYYTVIMCNNCHQIVYGIGPQGYQCSICLINLHRHCVRIFEDICPGPITKKDRGIMKLIGMRHDNNEHNRMKKSSQFLNMERERRQAEERDSSFELNESVEVKQSQPVSRSGSDRRPDAVREEGLKHQESASGTESPHDVSHDKTDTAAMASSTILPAVGSQRRSNTNINRSESVKEQSEKRKQRRNISDPSHNTTSGDVDLDRHTALSNTDSGSSSNSSISCNGRLSESPSNSIDAVVQAAALRGTLDSDSDYDAESEQWQSLVPPEELRNLPPHEKKRQDVINELFHTESSHVRNLKVLYKIFYRTIQDSQTLKPEELSLLFPNIKELLDLHMEFNKEMRRRRKEDPIVKELGFMLANMFGDRYGESLKKAAATFCERQQLALEFIKKRRERDSKFDAVLIECEKKRQCRRLQLQGILPTEMQRLSKYPLLLERLMHSIESVDNEQSQQEELARLKRAHHMSKEILNHVNEAAKVAHNKHRLEEIQKHLDTSAFERSEQHIATEFRTLDLTKYRLILEGGMQLKRPNKPIVPVHILLLEEAVIILHREGDRFLLKFFQSGSPAQPQPLSPIIKMSMLLARTNAVCKNALFLVNMLPNNSQMYDLLAEDEIKREVWFKHFTDATEAYNKRQGKSLDRKEEAASDSESESVQDLPPSDEATERAEAVGGEDSTSTPTVDGVDLPSSEDKELDEEDTNTEEGENNSTGTPEMVAGGGVQTTRVSAEEWPLIQPSQVSIAVPPVHTAESMLTPLEQIRRKDAVVKQALEEKEGLVADMLSIPREHFQHIADMASMDTSTTKDISGQVLASIYQVHQLQKAVNESTNITELDAMAAKGGRFPSCASQHEGEGCSSTPLSVPASLVRDIAGSLNLQLTTLLSEVKQVEEERDRLRKEIHRIREMFHEENNLHSPISIDDGTVTPTTDCTSDSILNLSIQIVPKSDCEEAPE